MTHCYAVVDRNRVEFLCDASGRRDELGFTRRFEGVLADLFNQWRRRRNAVAA